VQKVREASARTKCENNLHQIGLALHAYADSTGPDGFLPSAHIETCAGGPGNWTNCHYYTGWGIQLLPFLEQDNLFRTYNNTIPNQDPGNQVFCQASVPVYTCPADLRADQILPPWTIAPDGSGNSNGPIKYRTGSYRCMTGIGNTSSTNTWGGFWNEAAGVPLQSGSAMEANPRGRGAFHNDGNASGLSPERLVSVTDGLSNTIFIGERHVVPGSTNEAMQRGPFWADTFNLYNSGATYPAIPGGNVYLSPDYDKCASAVPVGTGNANYCKYGWGSLHTGGGINFVFGDGHVATIQPTIDQQVFIALSTIAGGEVIPNY
jgi:prepilin-type processing-associated H-X9-DG protein